MTTAAGVLERLRAAGARVEVVGERLRIEAPAGAVDEELQRAVAARKPELMALLGGDDPPPAHVASTDAPLSYAQQGLWFLEQVRPGTAVSNSCAGFHIEGRLDVRALRQALDEVTRRHDALRTVFGSHAGVPTARVRADLRAGWSEEDLPCDGTRLQESVSHRGAIEARRLFDLTAAAPLRATLLRRDDREHVLLVNAHHIACDGWSFGVLGRELLASYAAFAAGRPSPLPPLAFQYGDYARWQKARLSGARLANLLAFWQERLRGAPDRLDVALDHPRPAAMSLRGAHRRHRLSPALSAAVRDLARSRGTTLFAALLTAFTRVLAEASGCGDVLVGGTVAGRVRSEWEPLIGVFVNTVVLRTDLRDRPAFGEALRRVTATVAEALLHQELPFERLVQELRPDVRPSHAPVVQVGFAMQNMPMPHVDVAGLRVTPIDVDNGAARADLVLFASDAPDGIQLSLEYSTDLYAEATADGLLDAVDRTLVEATGVAALDEDDVSRLADADVDALLRQLTEPR